MRERKKESESMNLSGPLSRQHLEVDHLRASQGYRRAGAEGITPNKGPAGERSLGIRAFR